MTARNARPHPVLTIWLCHGVADQFRNRAAGVVARAALGAPQQLKGLPLGGRVDPGEIPSLKQLGLTPPPQTSADAKPTGGEFQLVTQLGTWPAMNRVAKL